MTDILDASSQQQEIGIAKKERMFQVVPVPGVFTRGRWKCWDYRNDEQEKKEKEMLQFEKDKEKTDTNEVVTIQVSSDEGAVTGESNASDQKDPTIVVVTTSSAIPTPVTPLSGSSSTQEHESVNRVTSIESNQDPSSADSSIGNIPSSMSVPSNLTHAPSSNSVNANQVNTSQTQTTPNLLNQQQAQASASSGNIASRPSSDTMTSSMEEGADKDSNVTTAASSIPASANVAAIDNKIEQAMDLVKTHLTFAVREEVEILRQTIAELELKVMTLEDENQLLRQYAPQDVVSNLPQLVAQHRSANPPPATATSTPAPTLPPLPKVPAELSTVSSFESTLHSVVADVRHEISGGASGIVRK
ncbi:hypothetical protein WR25_03310 [Diploscapter pachys]|uniref:TSC22 domain family protein 1 n=1 Tax=Diploscapter pachys TaxID=2018661 RepID=A0A2A2L3F6_9BILA|nr:hypothetical protein WR25_03310 [Diploscapter pachys]